jgi:c-di-GMP-binding flagellar brake protein YcgR
MTATPAERRKHPRVQAPVLFRPAGAGSIYERRQPEDVSLGGLRVQTPERLEPGNRLDVELLLPDQWLVICPAEVVWVKGSQETPSPPRSEYVVGMKFVEMTPADRSHLVAVLSQ